MNFYWIYELANWQFAVICVGSFVTFALMGLFLTKNFIQRNAMEDHNELLSAFMSGLGALYGITLGLIAVAAWENFDKIGDIVSSEAAVVISVYNDFRRLPEPYRGTLTTQLKSYVKHTIDEAWPAQQKGKVNKEGLSRLQNTYRTLLSFEPTNASQEILLDGATKNTNQLITLLESRMEKVEDGLPSAVWYVIIFGAILNISVTWLFHAEKRKVYTICVALYAALLGSLIFLVAAMDNPFRGEFSVSPDAFVAILQYMK